MTTLKQTGDSKVCFYCIAQRPESEMTKDVQYGLNIFDCGCGKREPPFMTSVAGHVLIHDAITAETLPSDWCGICVSARDAKAFWLIGQDYGERSYTKLPVEITKLPEARAYVKKHQQFASEKAQLSATKNWQALQSVEAVICEELPNFLGAPTDWLVMNAPRPLLGFKVCEDGPFNHGRFYAAIDPAAELAEKYIEKNLKDDARVVFIASKELQLEMAVELIPVEFRSRYFAMDKKRREETIAIYVQKLQRKNKLGEYIEIARQATLRMNELALIELAETADQN